MKSSVFPAAFAAVMVSLPTGCASVKETQAPAQDSALASALPANRDELRELNSTHLRLVRRASNLCIGAFPAGGGQRIARPVDFACVISLVDAAVVDTQDGVLAAFHAALPIPDRYDQDRPDAVWQRLAADTPH